MYFLISTSPLLSVSPKASTLCPELLHIDKKHLKPKENFSFFF